MATFCFKCPNCDERVEDTSNDPIFTCPACGGGPMRRDYRAEAVGFGNMTQLRTEREEGGVSGIARTFLPSNEDFKGPEDPDGTKGMREWRDRHRPRSSNKNPHWPGEVEKKTWGYGGKGSKP